MHALSYVELLGADEFWINVPLPLPVAIRSISAGRAGQFSIDTESYARLTASGGGMVAALLELFSWSEIGYFEQ